MVNGLISESALASFPRPPCCLLNAPYCETLVIYSSREHIGLRQADAGLVEALRVSLAELLVYERRFVDIVELAES
jgi:hypothetical protein